MTETNAHELEDDELDLEEYVEGLQQDDGDADDADGQEDVIELSALEKLAEIERDLGLVPRDRGEDEQEEAHDG